MKTKTKKIVETAISIFAGILFAIIFVCMVLFSGFIMRAGVMIESEMPSMQNDGLQLDN